MRTWLLLLGPLLLWALHFMGLYLAAEFAPAALPIFGAFLTVLCLAAIVLVTQLPAAKLPAIRPFVVFGGVIALIAVAWQSLPIVLELTS